MIFDIQQPEEDNVLALLDSTICDLLERLSKWLRAWATPLKALNESEPPASILMTAEHTGRSEYQRSQCTSIKCCIPLCLLRFLPTCAISSLPPCLPCQIKRAIHSHDQNYHCPRPTSLVSASSQGIVRLSIESLKTRFNV